MEDGGRFRIVSLRCSEHCVRLLVVFLAWAGLCQSQQVGPETAARAPAVRNQRARREQWFMHGRTVPGESGAALRYRAHLQKLQMRTTHPATSAESKASPGLSTSGWSPLGPAPLASDASGDGQQDYSWVSGRATAVAIDPADASGNTVYVGGAYGGVWKSANATTQNPASVIWAPLIDNQATLAVGAIAIQPGGTGVVLVGTGEANSSADSYYGLGILRSANAGATWTLISSDSTGTHPFAGMAFSKIAFSTVNPNLVVAAAAGASEGIIEGLANPPTANLGLYYSTDGGSTWTSASVMDGTVTTSPGSATAVVYNATSAMFFAAFRYHGFYSSSDGINWTRLANQPGAGLTPAACPAQGISTCPIYRGEIAVVPGRSEMYAWPVDVNDIDQGIWVTTNGGTNWTQINETGIIECGDDAGCGTEQGTYNLELAAVPDGNATDLYAGAVNLYRCQITSASPNCSGSGPNTFLNLTHAYGCSAIAQVHPAQHAVSFLVVNNNQQDVMYFANDGGVYRALNGYSLIDGACDGHPPLFDSLNQTLGSMTQFVSFSEPAGDTNTILGGTQGNGSPATQSAQGSSTWQTVNAGDGGYSLINPDDANEWFVSSPPDSTSGVNIFRCASGISCHTQDFQNDQVGSSATLGGDTGAYYPPYILDPQNSGELIVGTCRMWRGSTTGAGFSALSNNFETGGTGICTGGETNLVRSLAAGGPTVNGFSGVIYAGTDGFGPLISTVPPGGHVWVGQTAPGGAVTWVDQTGPMNPDNFPISGIAIDSSDTSGLTAYASIMGFHVSHLWKTSNGGASWTDFTGTGLNGLPDAPANAVLIDPGTSPLTGTLYVGTDVGVFSSPTASPNWTEAGPAPGSGQSGYLPNVAVTALGILDDGVDKWLRASTYGRGVWQFPVISVPDFEISVPDTPPTTVFVGSPGVFQSTALSLDGYNFAVSLTCVTAPHLTCSVSPNSVTPTASGAAFKVTTGGPADVYNFNLHEVGSDPGSITHNTFLTLYVVDFSLNIPSPDSTRIGPAATSPPVALAVTASGPFNQAVALSCSGLPGGAVCNFQPSNSVNPTASSPVNVTLTIGTASYTTAGTFAITISAATANGPTKTQGFSLTVTKDYALTVSNPSLTAVENSTATFKGTLTSLNGYNSPVNLSCGKDAPPTCTVAPARVTPTESGAPFTATVSSNRCGQYNFDIVAQGTNAYAVSHSTPVTFSSTSLALPDYTLEINNPSLSAALNTSATFTGTLTSSACYGSPVQLSCGSGSPPTCAASPASLTPTISGAPFTVAVSSTQAKTYSFEVVGEGTDPLSIQQLKLVSFTASSGGPTSDFSITDISGPEEVAAGQSAIFEIQVSPGTGTFLHPITLAWSACPALSTCSLSQTQVASGKSATTVNLIVQTSAAVVARATWPQSGSPPLYALLLWLPGFIFTVTRSASSRPRRRNAVLLLIFTALALLSVMLACGGGLQGGGTAVANPGTPAGTYNITVAATMTAAPGSPTKPVSLTLTVN